MWAQAAAAFVVAGLWIAVATMLAERLGSRVGGMVGNLPSNILVALVFVAAEHGTGMVRDATHAVPTGMAVDSVFLLVFAAALRWGLAVAIVASLAAWAGLAFAAARWSPDALGGTYGYVAVTAVCLALLGRMGAGAQVGIARTFTRRQIAVRAAFAGTIVATTVVLAGIVGPYWTGLLATFPAVLLSTLVILALARGAAFAQATAKVLCLTSSNILVYAWGVHALYPRVGIAAGTLLALALAAGYVAALRPAVERMR